MMQALHRSPHAVSVDGTLTAGRGGPRPGRQDPGPLTRRENVLAVVANPDPVARNLQITQSYHELGRALAGYLGPRDLPWAAFATWASMRAGASIRRPENVPRLSGSPALRRWARCSAEDVRCHAAAANQRTYAKMAPLFADFLLLAESDGKYDPSSIAAFLAGIAGDDTNGFVLQRAFRSYYTALFEKRPKVRAELVFTGNVLVALHEQLRLQETITAWPSSAPVHDALLDAERRPSRLLPPLLYRAAGIVVLRLGGPWIRAFEEGWRRHLARSLTPLAGHGSLSPSENVPPPSAAAVFPDDLKTLLTPDARSLAAEHDRARHPAKRDNGRAADWACLADRMACVVDFLRRHQQDAVLGRPPYRPRQVEAIHRGEVPAGIL